MVICIIFCSHPQGFPKTNLALEKLKAIKNIIKCTEIPPGLIYVLLTYLAVLAIFAIVPNIYCTLESSHSTIEERNRYNWIQAKKGHQSQKNKLFEVDTKPKYNLNNVLAPSPTLS